MVFNPQNCFCRTAELQKLTKKVKHIRCICKKTRWQAFRQVFTKKKIYCPCLKDYKQSVVKLEKKHKKTCACCRKVLESLHLVTSDKDNDVGCWRAFCGIFSSSCSGGKCKCCRKVCEKIGGICGSFTNRCLFCKKIGRKFSKKEEVEEAEIFDDSYEDNDYDWWTKFYSSLKVSFEMVPSASYKCFLRSLRPKKVKQHQLEINSDWPYTPESWSRRVNSNNSKTCWCLSPYTKVNVLETMWLIETWSKGFSKEISRYTNGLNNLDNSS